MSQFLSLAGWYFLPNLVSGWTQTALYSIFIRAGEPHPQPGTPKFIKHRRTIQICVILLYLAYTVYEADWELQREGDLYGVLGVGHDVDERRVKSVARRLMAKVHPDKSSQNSDQFIIIRTASDVLGDPVKRWAYDRFGFGILGWKDCITIRDYVAVGFETVYPTYVASAVGLGILYFLGYMETGKYFRFLAVVLVFALESFVVTRAAWPRLLTHFVNPGFAMLRIKRAYIPYQAVALLRKLSITAFVAHAQIMPLLQPPQQTGTDEQQLRANLDRIEASVAREDQETALILGLEMTPFMGDERDEKHLQQRLQEWLVQNTVASHPAVRDARGRAIEQRRTGAPHGARGTT